MKFNLLLQFKTLQVGSIEQSERTASFTLRSENPVRMGAQQRNPESNPAGNPGVTLRGTLLRSKSKRRLYDLVDASLWSGSGRFVGSPISGDHGSPSSAAGVALVLAVAKLLAVATFEVGITGRSGARWTRARLLLLLLLTARGRRTSGPAPVFKSLEPKILSVDFFVEAVGRSVCVSRDSRGRG